MRVVDRLAEREEGWRELQLLLFRIGTLKPAEVPPREVLRLGELYRSACADLMLAEAHDLPRDTVAYLHALVGRAHNAVYKTQGFRWADWAALILREVPRQLRGDPLLRVSAMVFWGLFLLTAFVGAADHDFVVRVVGTEQIEAMETMYDSPFDGEARPGGAAETAGRPQRSDAAMSGFYIYNNAGIGLRCYASGLCFGVGTLFILATNAIQLGTIFGHMATVPQAGNFFTFVTAHGPFELTAIVFSGAAGLRLGSGLIVTRGQSRLASLRREAAGSLPTVGVAVILFVLAAFLEGFVSASGLPYWSKAAIAIGTAGILLVYLFGLGRGSRPAATSGPTLTTEAALGVR